MHQDYKLVTSIVDDTWAKNAIGVVMPVPSETANQRVLAMQLPKEWEYNNISSHNVPQNALFVRPDHNGLAREFSIDFAIPKGTIQTAHLRPHAMESLEPRDDAHQLAETLGLHRLSQPQQVERILGCLINKFHYQHGINSDLPLTSCSLTGNCLDINSAFIKMLRVAGVKNAYYIGYFFPADQPLVNDDWHCWVDTQSSRGYENWDIAHQLKINEKEVRSTLNPIPGIRFAMSTGRDLLFKTQFGTFTAEHLCEPRWVFKDGSTRACRVLVKGQVIEGVKYGNAC